MDDDIAFVHEFSEQWFILYGIDPILQSAVGFEMSARADRLVAAFFTFAIFELTFVVKFAQISFRTLS